MKRFSMVMMLLAGLAITVMIGCAAEKTELAFTNDSTGKINDIIWADGDATWNSATGYAVGYDTESKDVEQMNGTVECSIYKDSSYVTANVYFPSTNSSSLSLNEGESNKYVLKAIPQE